MDEMATDVDIQGEDWEDDDGEAGLNEETEVMTV
jgi:hypothetical protein